MTTRPTWDALVGDAARGISDTDEIREHGEWMTGGSCTALGAVVDHGGDTYHVMLTSSVHESHSPTDDDDLAHVGVYQAGAEYDPDAGNWAVALRVPREDVVDVVAALIVDVHDYRCSEIALDPVHWRLNVNAVRMARKASG